MRLLNVEKLKIGFVSPGGLIRAVEGIDLQINRGESVALVGESGCGKSVTAFSLMRLLNAPPAIIKADKIELFEHGDEPCEHGDDPCNLLNLSESQMQHIRANHMGMIFQDPSSSLNPVMTVGQQIDEVFARHRGAKQNQAKEMTLQMMKSVKIPGYERRYKQYPHELSGGMKQRILIAMALACKPQLLIADEPTTALDVTVQAQIMSLIKEMTVEYNTAMLLITHDLGVAAASTDRVYVMYSGKIVEHGSTQQILHQPMHPYTQGLIEALPKLDGKKERFTPIPLSVPHPSKKPSGCYFHPRCKSCMGDVCKTHMPPLVDVGEGRQVRCWHVARLSPLQLAAMKRKNKKGGCHGTT